MDDICLPSGRRLKELKVAELKKELTKRRQSTAGKKADLIERLYQSIIDDNFEDNGEIQGENQSDECSTPQKLSNILESASMRKSSRSERYIAQENSGIATDNSFLSDDEQPSQAKFNVRRSSAIRRSVLRDLGIQDNLYGSLFVTPDRDEVERPILRTGNNSREKTVEISPGRSKIRNTLSSTQNSPCVSSGTPRRPPKIPSAQRGGSTKRVRRSASLEPCSSLAINLKRRSGSVEPTKQTLSKSRSSATRIGSITNRFAAQHKKLMEKGENLAERKERLQKRHQDLIGSTSSTLKRLATPKNSATSRLPRRVNEKTGFTFNTESVQNFTFGNIAPEDYSKITQKTTVALPSRERVAKRTSAAKMTAKELGKKSKVVPRKLTRPDDRTFVNFMATPKGHTPTKTPKRSGYVSRGALSKFVDTSKLNDREFELAREAGIIPGPKSSRTKIVSAQMIKNQKKREDILNIRRKLNL